MPEPEIVEKSGGVSTTLFVQAPEGNVEKMSEKTSEKMSEKTSEKIIKAILLDPQITIAELANLTGVTTRSVERNIGSLRKAGRLTRSGPDKGGHWEVIVDKIH